MSDKEICRYKLDDVSDLGYTSYIRVDMPKGAKIVHLSYIGGTMWLHAIVNPKHKEKARWFAVFTEGTTMEEYEKKTFEYIGMVNWAPVYHVFEVHD